METLLLRKELLEGELSVHVVTYILKKNSETFLWQVLVSFERLARVFVQERVGHLTWNENK